MVHLFVYGTLKKGGYYHHALRGGKYIKTVRIPGYDMYFYGGGNYPVIIPGEGSIVAELYNVDESILRICDRIEGYYGEGQNNLYERIEVESETGEKGLIYVPPEKEHERIRVQHKKVEDGDWDVTWGYD